MPLCITPCQKLYYVFQANFSEHCFDNLKHSLGIMFFCDEIIYHRVIVCDSQVGGLETGFRNGAPSWGTLVGCATQHPDKTPGPCCNKEVDGQSQ